MDKPLAGLRPGSGSERVMYSRNSKSKIAGSISGNCSFPVFLLVLACLWPASAFAQLAVSRFADGLKAGIEVTKFVRTQGAAWHDVNDPKNPLSTQVGALVDYRIRVRNNGSEPLLNITVEDPLLGFLETIPTLGIGSIAEYSPETGYSELDDVLACIVPGLTVNTATAEGTPKTTPGTVMDEDVAWVNCVAALPMDIGILKQIRIPGGDWADADDAMDPDTPEVEYPSAAEYRIRVANNGGGPLLNVEVTDPMLGLVGLGGAGEIGPMNAGDVIYLLPIGEMNPADATEDPIFLDELSVDPACDAAETITNTATVTGLDKGSDEIVMASNDANLVCVEPPVPDIEIIKQIRVPGGDWQDADDSMDPDTPVVPFPSAAEYRIRVENTGETPLFSVVVNDPLLGLEDLGLPPMSPGDVVYLLPPGEPVPPDASSSSEEGELSVDPACDAAETVTNIASVSGENKTGGGTVMDDDPANLVCEEPLVPDIEIIKEISVDGGANWSDANDAGSAPTVGFPSGALYRMRVENTGETPLINLVVNDATLGLVNVALPPLAPGDVVYLVPPGQPSPPADYPPEEVPELDQELVCDEPGTFTNIADVTADPKGVGDPVMDEDPAVLVCEDTGICLVVIDEEGLDNDFLSVEYAASAIGVEPDELINDDQPTEFGNPPLLWNEIVEAGLAPDPQGRLVKLPTGEVDDEGWFALPPGPNILYKDKSRPPNCGLLDYQTWIDMYVAGTLPQRCLDEVLDVMPIRNQELANLVGQTCVAVVYDSDISINYHPLQGNLQGERYGLFTFTVIALEVPGTLPESGSSTSLYDLWLYVEPPETGGVPFQVPIHDHEPDSIEIVSASYSSGVLTVIGESDWAPGAYMTVTVAGEDAGTDPLVGQFLLEEPMTYFGRGMYRIDWPTGTNVRGRRLSIQTDEGGAYNDRIR